MLNLDTHIVLFALSDSLTAPERKILSKEPWGISCIVLWEIATLSRLGRIDLDLNDPEVSRALSNLHVWQIDLDISREIRNLDFRSDPADEIIAATSVVHRAKLLTRDKKIRASKLVPFA